MRAGGLQSRFAGALGGNHLRGGRGAGEVNVTPLIDVVMCLIIFFLIVGRLAAHRQVALPHSGTGVRGDGVTPIVIEIVRSKDASAAEPQIVLSGREIDLAGLELAMKDAAQGTEPGPAVATDTQAPPRPVHIRAAGDLPYSMLSPVLNACRRAGWTSVRLVTERAR